MPRIVDFGQSLSGGSVIKIRHELSVMYPVHSVPIISVPSFDIFLFKRANFWAMSIC